MSFRTCAAVLILTIAACGDDTEGTTSSSGGPGGSSSSTSGSGGSWESLQGQSCPASGCPPPLECVTYCGFAGCDNGSFMTCEIPCEPGAPMCPANQICVTVSDGPGDVCMPE